MQPGENDKQSKRDELTPRSKENAFTAKQQKRKQPGKQQKNKKMRVEKDSNDSREREVDTFCWICHKLCHDKICSACPRVYHTGCLKSGTIQSISNSVCPECQKESVDGKKLRYSLSCFRLKELLKLALEKVFVQEEPNSIFISWPSLPVNYKLCHIIDMEILIDKINGDRPFSKIVEFFTEVKWIYHNCCIIFRDSSAESAAAKRLVKIFRNELLDIEACPECYFNKYSEERSEDFFTTICEVPHTLVWAKLKGFPYWPAKCLKVADGIADVRYFGTHDKSRIAVNKCFLMSSKCPNEKTIKKAKYMDALAELEEYLANYERRFGNFKYAPMRTPLTKEGNHFVKAKRKKDKIKASQDATTSVQGLAPTVYSVGNMDENEILEAATGGNSGNETLGASTGENDVRIEILDVSTGVTEEIHHTGHKAKPGLISQSVPENHELEDCLQNSHLSKNLNYRNDGKVQTPSSNTISVCMTFSTEDGILSENINNHNQLNTHCFPSTELPESTASVATHSTNNVVVPNDFTTMNSLSEVNSIVNIGSGDIPCTGMNSVSTTSSNEMEGNMPVNEGEGLSSVIQSAESNCEEQINMPSPVHEQQDNNLSQNATLARIADHKEYREHSALLVDKLFGHNPLLKKLIYEAQMSCEAYFCRFWIKVIKFKSDAQKFLTHTLNQLREVKNDFEVLKKQNEDLKVKYENLQKSAQERSDNASYVINIIKLNVEKESSSKWECIVNEKSKIIEELNEVIKKQTEKLNQYEKDIEILKSEKIRVIEEKDSLIQEKTEKEKEFAEVFEAQKNESQIKEKLENKCCYLENELAKLRKTKKDEGLQTDLHHDQIVEKINAEKTFHEHLGFEKLKWDREKNDAVIEAKRCDWCVRCLNLANIHCCLNTNYCDRECQSLHWREHANLCQKKCIPMASTSNEFPGGPNNFCQIPSGSLAMLQQTANLNRTFNLSISENTSYTSSDILLLNQNHSLILDPPPSRVVPTVPPPAHFSSLFPLPQEQAGQHKSRKMTAPKSRRNQK